MTKMQATLYENKGATKESAPFLGKFVSLGDVDKTALVSAISKLTGFNAVQTEAQVDVMFTEIAEIENEELTMIHFPGFTVYVGIYGSFESADAAFDPTKNSVQIAFKLDDELRNSLAGKSATIVTDETSTKVKMLNVMDMACPKPYELIHGTGEFAAAGYNIRMDDAGASAYFEDAQGVIHHAIHTGTVRTGTQEKFRPLELMEGGDYKFWVNTRGGDAEGPLQSTFRKVKVLKVGVAPLVPSDKNMIIDKLTAPITGGAAVAIAGDKIAAHSATAGGISAVSLKLTADASAVTQTYTVAANGKAINIASLNCGSATVGSYPNAKLIITYQKAGAEGATEALEMGVTAVVTGPSVTKVTTSLGDNKARYDLQATVTGSNLSAVTKIGYHFFNDQSEECDTPAFDSATITCSADGTTLTISALPNAQSGYGIPQGTWDIAFYKEDDTLLTWLDNVEYVPA